jgi:hypothetical protein
LKLNVILPYALHNSKLLGFLWEDRKLPVLDDWPTNRSVDGTDRVKNIDVDARSIESVIIDAIEWQVWLINTIQVPGRIQLLLQKGCPLCGNRSVRMYSFYTGILL